MATDLTPSQKRNHPTHPTPCSKCKCDAGKVVIGHAGPPTAKLEIQTASFGGRTKPTCSSRTFHSWEASSVSLACIKW